jgi:hypothetical protein
VLARVRLLTLGRLRVELGRARVRLGLASVHVLRSRVRGSLGFRFGHLPAPSRLSFTVPRAIGAILRPSPHLFVVHRPIIASCWFGSPLKG